MQSTKSHSNFWQKKYFKVKDRKTKGERGTVYFQIAVNVIHMFLYVRLMYFLIRVVKVNQIIHILGCTCAFYFCL